jgi:alpha/beta superfamily hydrolase
VTGALPPAGETTLVSGGRRLHGMRLEPPGVPRGALVVTHPHPAHGGHSDHPVVVATAERGAALGLATLRFDFRGVRQSEGEVADFAGHLEDVRAACRALRARVPRGPLLGAGFSYGARALARLVRPGVPSPPPLERLVLLAPAIHVPRTRRDFGSLLVGRPLRDVEPDEEALHSLSSIPLPVHVIVGELDPVAPHEELRAALPPHAILHVLPGLNHFFARAAGAGPPDRATLDPALTAALTP